MKKALLTTFTLAITSLYAFASEGWMTDFEAAKALAKKEGKSLLVDFTGSDWCGWCIKLDEEVFSQDAFKKGSSDYVLVSIDFPNDKSRQSAELQKQNKKLQTTYKVQGFPAIILMDDQGRPFAATGYQHGGPKKYLKHLKELSKKKETIHSLIAEADTKQGLDKAKLLLQAYHETPEDYRHLYTDLADKIKANDPEDTLGLNANMKLAAEKDALFRELTDLVDEGKVNEGLKKLNAFVTEKQNQLSKDQMKEMLLARISINLEAGNFDAIPTLTEDYCKFAPDSPEVDILKQQLLPNLNAIKAEYLQRQKDAEALKKEADAANKK